MAIVAASQCDESSCSPDEIIEDVLDNIDGHIHGPDGDTTSAQLRELLHHSRLTSKIQLGPIDVSSTEGFCRWMSGSELGRAGTNLSMWNYHRFERAVEFYLTDPPPPLVASEVATQPKIKVIGRFCPEDLYDYKAGLLDFCIQARKVFIDQPARSYLYGLYLRGSLLELWIFDRSGIHCFHQLDVALALYQFSVMLHNFRDMVSANLGESKLLQHGKLGLMINLENQADQTMEKIYLEDHPIAFSEDTVGSGTTCYRGRALNTDTYDLVVKFKWRLAEKRPEEQILKLAELRGAKGILSLRYEETLYSTSELRQFPQDQAYRKFCDLVNLSSQSHDGAEKQRGILACTEETTNKFENRYLTLVVLSPAGRPLQSFKDGLDLLRALRDAIKAHRSLFQTAKILHQDVSSGNIIIVDPVHDGEPHSILIDLDAAMDQAETRGEPGSIIGTRPYMAIGVLLARRHTYRHDLESFLYVFIRTIIANGADNPPPASRLRQWTQGDFGQSATLKLHDMEELNFQDILAEFPARYSHLKPLAETLRQILFPVVDGQLWTATNGSLESTNTMYDGFIGAFDKYIALERSQ